MRELHFLLFMMLGACASSITAPAPTPITVPKVDEASYQRSHFATISAVDSRDRCILRHVTEAATEPMSSSEMRRSAHELSATCSAPLWETMRQHANEVGEQ